MCCFIGFSQFSFSQTANTLPPIGNVGVGTTTPNSKLEVVGESKLSGKVTIDSTVVIKDSVTIQKKLTVDQDIKVLGTSVFVGDGTFKSDLKVLGVTKLKDKLVVDSTVVMNSDVKIFGDLKIKSLADTALTTNRLVSINPNGKLIISNLKLAVDDMYICSAANIAPWVGADGTQTDDDILLCPNYKSVTIGGELTVQGKSILKTAGIGDVLPTEIGGINPTFYVKRETLPNAIVAKFEASDFASNRAIFFSNTLTNGGHNPLSVAGDVGMFWSNTNGSGLVIAPEITATGSPSGMRITNSGHFGFNTSVDNQVQYNMQSNSTVGLLINTTNTPNTFFGLRTVANSFDVAISVANPAATLTDPSFFSVAGNGAVNIRTSAMALTNPFSITDEVTNTDIFVVNGDGSVGIGTTALGGKLTIAHSFDDVSGRANHIYLSDPTNADIKGYIGINNNTVAGTDMEYLSIEAVEENIHWMNIILGLNGGNVGIGTTAVTGARLSVEGTIRAREVDVNLTGWSDFVFNDSYTLKTLNELETYIANNKHLPDVPTEKEVLANGVSLGKMNAILLQKVEELTLYILQLNKEVKQLKAEK